MLALSQIRRKSFNGDDSFCTRVRRASFLRAMLLPQSYYGTQTQSVERPTEKPGGSSSRCGKGFYFPQSTSSADSLTVSVQPPCAISHASTSVRTLKIPNTGSHTIVWTQENTTHAVRTGSAALTTAVPYPGKATRVSCKGQ